MRRIVLWIGALVASVGLHLGIGLALPVILAPEPIDTQARPKSQVQIETQDVARSDATSVAPDSPAAASQATTGAELAQGAIAQSRAEPVTPPAEQVAANIDPAPQVAAVPPPTIEIAVTPAPVTQIAATEAPAVDISATIAPRTAIVASPSAAPTLVASAAPSQSLSDTTAAQSSTIAPIPPPAERFTAALAFSGDAGAQIDAASLATIQSFMRPGDVQAQTDEVRDTMQTLLESVPCSRLQAAFNPVTGSIELRGHVPEEGLRGPILAALQAQVGTGIRVADAMLILPRPQCGALAGIGAVGLPQSTDQLTNPLLVGADAHARAYDYAQGDQMILDLAAPDYDAYIYVDFFDANGDVIHLVPNDTVPLTLRDAKSAMRIGAGDAGEPFLNITIGPPYGQEIAAAFAASSPLYDGIRPISEPAEAYLAWMAGQVATARAADPDFKGEWVYFFVSTAEN